MPDFLSKTVEFGKFRLDVGKKMLTINNETINLSLKEIELLCVLVNKNGELVTKEELINQVWADSFIEESNLSRHIYKLRKTLANYQSEELIETVPKRGYRWKGEINSDVSQDLIIEKHSITRTVIEEIEANPNQKALSTKVPKKIKIFIPLIILLISTTVIGFFVYKQTSSKTEGIKKVAIGQIVSLSNSEEERTLALGIKEKLLMNFGSLDNLQIQNVRLEESEIDKITTSDFVLFGTVQKIENNIRVNLRLLKTSDKKQIWAESFDENEMEIFKLQDKIGQKITNSFSLNLTKIEHERFYKRYTENQKAYQHYLRGRYFFDKRNPENYKKALIEFNQAIELDKNYALAYSGLADIIALTANVEYNDRQMIYEKALQNAQKALEIDPNLAEALTSIAWIKRISHWNWAESERDFKRAIELNPNYVNARQWYGHLLAVSGRFDEALAENQKAAQIEPLSKIVLINRQAILIFQRKYDEAEKVIKKSIELEQDKRADMRMLSIFYVTSKNDEKVIEIVEKYGEEIGILKVGDQALSNLATAYHRTGKIDKANELFDLLEQKAKSNPEIAFRLAQAYSDLGRKDEAIAHLQRCYKDHDDRMVWLKVEPRFDNIRNDKRFQDLLQKMNL